MKNTFLLIAILFSLISSAQTTNIPVTSGDNITINKNGISVSSYIAGTLDSAFRFVLTTYQKVAPPIPPTPIDSTYGNPTYQNTYNSTADINANQLGRGGISTIVFKTGPGSFRSEVRAGDAPISSGWRSEQQYEEASQNPIEGAVEYDVYYENWSGFDGGGHTVQWHPYTGGGSAIVSLQNYGGKFDVTLDYDGNVHHQPAPLKSCISNTWYHLRWEFKWSKGTDGYVRLFVDGVKTFDYHGRSADGSGQYFKLGQNRWPPNNVGNMKVTSICYYDNLKIYKKGSGSVTPPPVNQSPTAKAGNDITLTLPANATTLNGSASTDIDGSIISYNWSLVSGPSTYTVASPSSATTAVTNLVAGTYNFKLTVTDNQGAVGADNINIVVNDATPPIPPVDTTGIALEGFGKDAVGGSLSSTVIHVSSKAQFDAALGSNRTILFDVDLVFIDRVDLVGISYLTVDANGHDVTLNNNMNGDGFSFDGKTTHHCILRGLRVINSGGDGINVIGGAHDILITNCSAYNNGDGNIDIAGSNTELTKNVTLQWCIIGPHVTSQGGVGGTLVTGQSVSVHHNLFAPSGPGEGERCPLVHCNYSPVGAPNAEVINNLVWKFGRSNGTGSGYAVAVCYNATGNVINNYGYTVGTSPGSVTNTDDGYGGGASGKAYITGNVSGNGANANGDNNHAIFPATGIMTQDACSAARLVLKKAGPAKRSDVELAIIADATKLNGCPVQ